MALSPALHRAARVAGSSAALAVVLAVPGSGGGQAAAGAGAASVPAVPAVAPGQAPGAGDASSYRLYRNPDGSAVRFDPCDPIGVRVNAQSEGAVADLREALGRLAGVTGLQFVVEGTTDFVPTRAARTLPGTDLVVSWVPAAGEPGGSDFLDAGQLGTGGWTTAGARHDDAVVWRTTGAFAVLDLAEDDDLEPGFGPGLTRGALLLHELSHALGVDHVEDSSQLMAPVLQRRAEPVSFGAGDLTALRAVGVEAGCLPG